MKNTLIVMMIFFVSCSSKKVDPVVSNFSKVTNLKSAIVPIKSKELGQVVDMKIMGSLLVMNEMFSDKIFKLFNVENGNLLGKYINKGKGPLEVLYPGNFSICDNASFVQYDRGTKQLDFFSVTTNKIPKIEFVKRHKIEMNEYNVYPITDSTFLFTGFFQNGRYCMYNLRSGKSSVSGTYPEYKEIKRINDGNKALVFQPHISINPNRKQFASFEGRIAYFEILDIDVKGVKKHFAKSYFDPIMSDVKGEVGFTKENPFTFHSVYSSNRYIYVIYSGRSRRDFGEECYAGGNLLVYDWNGNPVVNYKLDRFLKIMTLDLIKMVAYGFCTNPVTGEPEIVKYQLPNENNI